MSAKRLNSKQYGTCNRHDGVQHDRILCLFEDKYLVLASVYIWGIGDALATLVGKRFGQHKIQWRIADGKKNEKGSLAIFVCALVSVFAILLIGGWIAISLCHCIAMLATLVCTLTEMCAKNGLDTVICTMATMLVIVPCVVLL